MLPFYFLSVLTNAIIGLMFSFFYAADTKSDTQYPILQDTTFLLVLLIFSGIAAVFKLLSPVGGILIIGDILPACTGIAGSLVLFTEWFNAVKPEKALPPFFEQVNGYQKLIGYACMISSLLHLLFSELPVL